MQAQCTRPRRGVSFAAIFSSAYRDISLHRSRDVQLPLHLRVGVRRPPGQDRRPGVRCRPRRHPGPGQARPRGLRDPGQDRRGDRRRRGHHHRLGGHRGAGAPGHQRHRLRQLRRRFRWPHLRHHQHARQAVAGHRRRRGRHRQEGQEAGGTGRRRPGPDVRLRLQRGPGIHAGADLLQPPPGRAAGQGAQEEELAAAVAAPGRQEPGHPAL